MFNMTRVPRSYLEQLQIEKSELLNAVNELSFSNYQMSRTDESMGPNERLRVQALRESRKAEIERHRERIAQIDLELGRLTCR